MGRARRRNQAIGRKRQTAGLQPFLERGLRIAWRFGHGRDTRSEASSQEAFCAGQSAITIHRPEQGLETIGQNRWSGDGPIRGPGAGLDPQDIRQADRGGAICETGLADQRGEARRQFTLGTIRESFVEHGRHDETENTVAKELKTIEVPCAAAPIPRRKGGVGHGSRKPSAIAKNMADTFLDLRRQIGAGLTVAVTQWKRTCARSAIRWASARTGTSACPPRVTARRFRHGRRDWQPE